MSAEYIEHITPVSDKHWGFAIRTLEERGVPYAYAFGHYEAPMDGEDVEGITALGPFTLTELHAIMDSDAEWPEDVATNELKFTRNVGGLPTDAEHRARIAQKLVAQLFDLVLLTSD